MAPTGHVCYRCAASNPWPPRTYGHEIWALRCELHCLLWTLAEPVCRPVVRGLTDLINRLTRKAQR